MTVPILSHHNTEYCINMLSDPSALRRDDDDDDVIQGQTRISWFLLRNISAQSLIKLELFPLKDTERSEM